MLEVAARIPDATARDQFADRLAHKAQDYGRGSAGRDQEGGRAAGNDGGGAGSAESGPGPGQNGRKRPDLGVGPADPGRAWRRWRSSTRKDLEGLATRGVLEQARSLQDWPEETLPPALLERLTKGRRGWWRTSPALPLPAWRPPRLRSGAQAAALYAGAGRRAARNQPAAGSRAPRQHEREIHRALGPEKDIGEVDCGFIAEFIWYSRKAGTLRRTSRCRSKKNTMK